MAMQKKRLGEPEKMRNGVRWKRMLHGITWKSPIFASDSRDNERAAWALWIARKEEIEREHTDKKERDFNDDPIRYDTLQQINEITRIARMIGDHGTVATNGRIVEILRKTDDLGVEQIRTELNLADDYDPIQDQGSILADAHEELAPEPLETFDTELLMEEWLAERLVEVRVGDITVGTLDNYRTYLKNLVAFCPDIRQMNEKMLLKYRSTLQERIIAGASPYTQRDTLATAKRFIEWCGDTAKVIPPLSNIRKQGTGISVPTKRIIKVWEDEQIAELFRVVTGAKRLYYLLMLNTGAYESDIGTWGKSRTDDTSGKKLQTVDTVRRTLTFKRHKEKDKEHVPTVTYRLWDETFELLRQHTSSHPTLLLTMKTGSPLWIDELKEDTSKEHKRWRKDNIGREYRRFKKDYPNFGTLDDLRKTAMSKFDDHNEYARYSLYFAGHSPRSVATTYYIKPSQTQFDNAVMWLGEQFGFKTT